MAERVCQWKHRRSNSTQILLCPDACTRVQNAPQGQIEATFGCATEIK